MLMIILTLLMLSGVIIVAIVSLRNYRLQHLRQLVQRELPRANLNSRPELAAMASLSAVELLWHWQQIDPEVVAAADFSSTQSIDSGFDFAGYIDDRVSGMNAESLAGFKNRLMGYVGEQHVADLLVDQGHLVEAAATSNQPIWDLIVDGHAVNVKTVADLAEIKATALAHPDVTYIVPVDAHGELTENMQRLEGFNHQDMSHVTDQAILDADPSNTLEGISMHLPIIPLLFSLARNRKAVQQGREVGVAAQHVVLDTLGRGGGAGLGALIGGTLGTVVGPIGTLIGATLGAIIGRSLGAQLAENIKEIPLKTALNLFEQRLQKFGAVYASRLQRVLNILYQPYVRQQQCLVQIEQQFKLKQKGIRWWIFPDFYSVLLEQTQQHVVKQLQQQKIRLAKIEMQLIDAHQKDDHRPLGLIMLNVPQMREALGVDLMALRHIEMQRERVYYERGQLNPDVFPPKQKKRNTAAIMVDANAVA